MNFLMTRFNRPAGRAIALLLLVIVFALFFEPIALTSYGVTLDRVVDIAIVAIGLTAVIILGEIDLSVGATMALSGVVAVKTSNNLIIGSLAGLAVGLAIGLLNSFLVLKAGVNSFIATLGTMTTFGGISLLITKGDPIPLVDEATPVRFSNTIFGQFTIPSVLMLILALAVGTFLARTRVGRDFYAIGGNVDAARAANIKIGRRRTLGFVMCSTLASIAGLVDTVKQAAASPNMGDAVLLVAIAGAVLGGASLSGGKGNVLGALIGSIALGGVSAALELHGIDSSFESVLIGAILFVAVASSDEGLAGLRMATKGIRFKR